MLALEFDNLTEEIEAARSGLTSVPGKIYLRPCRSFKMLNDVFFEEILRHPEGIAFGV